MPLDLLSYNTPYFDSYFNGEFEETLKLPYVCATTIQCSGICSSSIDSVVLQNSKSCHPKTGKTLERYGAFGPPL